ncbi:MAG: hypothetical protein CSA55_02030 [Ilumatobacter coccineus]|uniref:HTH tetR-type domain-containing protein n=1 Tax=Ilumatobacter coccineus TaxID=467094 RepID=A0A2G6KCF4_9ACTN|nr:MAG: hypothetical protein CSA55_02030 [Ilumatobacter coccineus]
MPRIAADTIAEHVAHQHKRVTTAAIELIRERGVAAVSMGDIAARSGLARSSLYRYYPSRGHIVAAWLTNTITPLIAESASITASDASRGDRLHRWITLQVDFLTNPDNAAMVNASSVNDINAEVETLIAQQHRDLYATLTPLMAGDPATRSVRTRMVAELTSVAARNILDGGDRQVWLDETLRAALALSAQ